MKTLITFQFACGGESLHGAIRSDGNLHATLAHDYPEREVLMSPCWTADLGPGWANLRTLRTRMLRWASRAGYTRTAEDWTQYARSEYPNWIAAEFTARLLAYLGRRKFKSMVKRNARYAAAGDHSVCASHEFCDANVFMIEAYEAVTGKRMRFSGGEDREQVDETNLVNAAWSRAKALWQEEAK